jgi:hypothetical protein
MNCLHMECSNVESSDHGLSSLDNVMTSSDSCYTRPLKDSFIILSFRELLTFHLSLLNSS